MVFTAGCLDSAPDSVDQTRPALTQALGNRPLVTLMMALPGPTAPEDQQWTATTQPVNAVIPDNFTPGLDTDVIVSTGGGACDKMLSIHLDATITHTRISDLYISVAAVSRDGRAVLKSQTVFDGPSMAHAGTSTPDMLEALNGGFDVSLLTKGGDCGRLRVNVTDLAYGMTGTLTAVTVKVRTAWFPFAHDRDFYTTQLFGPGFPNVADYVRENSRGAFNFYNAGVYGPVPWGNWHIGETDEEHVADVIAWLDALNFNFAALDANHDGTVTSDELQIVEYENSGHVGGANRGGCAVAPRAGVRVCVSVAFVSEQTDFATLAHEVSHSLGTDDLYGIWNRECWSNGLTLMSCTGTTDDNPATYYLDPWHRARLGWYSPAPTDCRASRLGDETWIDPASGQRSVPVRYTNPNNDHEYYLFEYRGQSGYDRDAADSGVVAWHVSENGDGSAYKGADGKQQEGHAIFSVSPRAAGGPEPGGSRAWKPTDGDLKLKWLDGTPLPYTFSIGSNTLSGTSSFDRSSSLLNCYDPSRFDFAIEPLQTTLAVNQTESLPITTTVGSCSPVQFAVTASPGIFSGVSSPSMAASGTSYLYLGVNAGTPPGADLVTVTGTCGGQRHAVTVQLTATACVPTGCGSNSCGEVSDTCGGTMSCGDCAAGLTCASGSCQAPEPKCKTPKQCCIQAGGEWANGHCW